MHFPNKAGDHEDTDSILFAELKDAGIPSVQDSQECGQAMNDMLRRLSGEVKTCVRGVLHGDNLKGLGITRSPFVRLRVVLPLMHGLL